MKLQLSMKKKKALVPLHEIIYAFACK